MSTYNFLCISCEHKGDNFMRTLGELGHRVFLVTGESSRDSRWPDNIEEIFYMPEADGRNWDFNTLKLGTAYVMRQHRIDRIIALDDYDVRKGAYLREEFRIAGMGQTTVRHFHDKLAMRIQAAENGLNVPGFCGLINDGQISRFLQSSRAPWLVKPRSDAGAVGIRKVWTAEEFWSLAESLGDNRSSYLIEELKPGTIYHVDSLSYGGQVMFSRASQYLEPPFDVAHGGGIFQSCTLDLSDSLHEELVEVNKRVLKAFGMKHGASHSEFIVLDGEMYFLETSARVGGANLCVLVKHATDLDLWAEWAKIEIAQLDGVAYQVPTHSVNNAGIIASLSRHEWPDYSAYQDSEIVWTLDKKYHVGFIFKSANRQRVLDLLGHYAQEIATNYHAVVPLQE